MDIDNIRKLNELNRSFYRTQAASFAATRQSAWDGWDELVQAISAHRLKIERIADFGCGNLRFERYLADALGGEHITAVCIDNCPSLASDAQAPESIDVSYHEIDLIEALMQHQNAQLACAVEHPSDLVVAFGLFHHIPTCSMRRELLHALARSAKHGGLVAASFWQFMDDERMSRKARETTERAQRACDGLVLEDGDYLLGWQGKDDCFRYCHSFSREEVDGLCRALAGQLERIADYEADGTSGTLNRYLVWRRI